MNWARSSNLLVEQEARGAISGEYHGRTIQVKEPVAFAMTPHTLPVFALTRNISVGENRETLSESEEDRICF